MTPHPTHNVPHDHNHSLIGKPRKRNVRKKGKREVNLNRSLPDSGRTMVQNVGYTRVQVAFRRPPVLLATVAATATFTPAAAAVVDATVAPDLVAAFATVVVARNRMLLPASLTAAAASSCRPGLTNVIGSAQAPHANRHTPRRRSILFLHAVSF